MLDEVEERLLGPVQVVEHADERPLLRACSSSLRNAQAISSAEAAAPSRRAATRSGAPPASSSGSAPSCLRTSTTGQYVIPSP